MIAAPSSRPRNAHSGVAVGRENATTGKPAASSTPADASAKARLVGPKGLLAARMGTGALVLHDVTFMEVWEALTILEPPIAEAAARARTVEDLASVAAAAELFASDNADAERAVHHTAEFFRCVGRATHNQVLGLAQEPLLQLLEPSLRVLIDKVPQARSRIATAQRRIVEVLQARDGEGARNWMAKHIRDFRKGFEIAQIDLQHRVTAA